MFPLLLLSGEIRKLHSRRQPGPGPDSGLITANPEAIRDPDGIGPDKRTYRHVGIKGRPDDDKRTSRDLEISDFEVVVNFSILDHDAVEPLPVLLPTPTLLSAECICFNVRGCFFC
jgi:hypothetical protein